MTPKTSGPIWNAIIIAIFIIALATQNDADKTCPNDWSYIHNEKCYSLHINDFHYGDAIEFCNEKGGRLWSETTKDEITFLRKLYVKVSTSDYWVGWHKDHDVWRYSSDDSTIKTDHHMKKSNKVQDKCAVLTGVDKGEAQLKAISCKWPFHVICEFKGDKCEQKMNSGDKCFQFLRKQQNFKESISKCQIEGGQLMELRNSRALDFYKIAIKKDKSFENLTETELTRQITSTISVWKGPTEDSEIYDDGMCEEYRNWIPSILPCNASRNFICMYQAIDYFEDSKDIDKETSTQPPLDDSDNSEQDNMVHTNIPVIPTWTIILMVIMGLAILSLLALLFRNHRVAAGFHHLGGN